MKRIANCIQAGYDAATDDEGGTSWRLIRSIIELAAVAIDPGGLASMVSGLLPLGLPRR